MEKFEVASFIKEVSAVNKMKSLLPMDILHDNILDVEAEIGILDKVQDISQEEKSDFASDLLILKESLEKEFNNRGK